MISTDLVEFPFATGKGLAARADRLLSLITAPAAAFAVVAEVAILLTGVVSRFVFNHPLTWSDELASIVFLWLAMLGSVIALRRGQHMRMTALVERVSSARQGLLEAVATLAPAIFLLLILGPSIDFMQDQGFVHTPGLRPSAGPRPERQCARCGPASWRRAHAGVEPRALRAVGSARACAGDRQPRRLGRCTLSCQPLDRRDRQLAFIRILRPASGARRPRGRADRLLLRPLDGRLSAGHDHNAAAGHSGPHRRRRKFAHSARRAAIHFAGLPDRHDAHGDRHGSL